MLSTSQAKGSKSTSATAGLDYNAEPKAFAKAAGLRYVSDSTPGILRKKTGRGFFYVGADGRAVRDPDTLKRIRSLVVPPAWTKVWICAQDNGHIQVTARDARGRKQYRYHARWREVRDENKYERMTAFGRALPRIRDKIKADLALAGLPRDKVLAAVVQLLETTFMRVGHERYARENNSFGLTTLRDRHVQINGEHMKFHFRGKSGKHHSIELDDRRLANIVKRCRDLPGYELFQYLDEQGEQHTVGASDVNDYLRAITGEDYTAKDFRTWAGTVLAAMALQEYEKFDSTTQAKKNLVRAIEAVAEQLGNTPSICRKCYIHPEVINAYLDGTMMRALQSRAEKALTEEVRRLRPEEAAVLGLLQQRLQSEVSKQAKGSERAKAGKPKAGNSKGRTQANSGGRRTPKKRKSARAAATAYS
ncbi:MAG: DNA topoisomerase IB [Betaproteobacteria bacterium]